MTCFDIDNILHWRTTGPKSDMCHFEKSHFKQKTLNHAVSKEC